MCFCSWLTFFLLFHVLVTCTSRGNWTQSESVSRTSPRDRIFEQASVRGVFWECGKGKEALHFVLFCKAELKEKEAHRLSEERVFQLLYICTFFLIWTYFEKPIASSTLLQFFYIYILYLVFYSICIFFYKQCFGFFLGFNRRYALRALGLRNYIHDLCF